MTVIEWNPLVNRELSLDGEYGLEGGYIETLEFESGKKRTHLKNSFVPVEYPSLSLMLNNTIPTESGKTEFEEFRRWHDVSLRYGILPFYFPRIGYRMKDYIKTPETGIYTFIPESLAYDRLDGIVVAGFGLKETGMIPETEYVFLAANNDEILFTDKGRAIVAN